MIGVSSSVRMPLVSEEEEEEFQQREGKAIMGLDKEEGNSRVVATSPLLVTISTHNPMTRN